MQNAENNEETRTGPAYGFQNLYGKAKDFVGKIFRRSDTTKEQASEKDLLEALIARVARKGDGLDPMLVPEEASGDFPLHIRLMVTEGFNDGVNRRISKAAESFAKAESEALHMSSLPVLAGKERDLSQEIDSRKEVVDDKQKQMKLHHVYQNYLQHHNKFNERGNTIGEFILYLFCFLTIFVADIPLAAEMLRRLFFVAANSKPIEWNTIWENGSVLLTAVGIALSTIYIKVCYDEFVGKKYGHAVISKKKFEELFVDYDGHIRDLDLEEKKQITKNEKVVRKIKIFLLGFTISAIVMLGIFRGYAWGQTNGAGGVPSVIVSFTLTFITLLFSIVSGVCLSISLSALTTYRRLRKIRKEGIVLEKAYLDGRTELSSLEGENVRVTVLKNQLGNGPEWKNNIYELLLSYYYIGYAEGRTVPGYYMQGLDFFDRVLLWREHSIAGTINNHVNQ